MNRNNLIAGILILVAFAALILGDHYGFIARSGTDASDVVRRWPAVQLGYCNAANLKPCIVSFSRMEGGMQINILLPASTYSDFYLTIRRGDEEFRYACQMDAPRLSHAHCTGMELFPGENLHFRLISLGDNTLLAEGYFAIIGLILATPEAEPTLTLEQPAPTEPTAIALRTPTPTPLTLFTPQPVTSSPTSEPSYPNPSYPSP